VNCITDTATKKRNVRKSFLPQAGAVYVCVPISLLVRAEASGRKSVEGPPENTCGCHQPAMSPATEAWAWVPGGEVQGVLSGGWTDPSMTAMWILVNPSAELLA